MRLQERPVKVVAEQLKLDGLPGHNRYFIDAISPGIPIALDAAVVAGKAFGVQKITRVKQPISGRLALVFQ